jgi:large subunit ribosomal protein L17
VRDRAIVGKLFDELSMRYRDWAGGYTRIVKMGNRVGDNAPVSIIEFIREVDQEQTKKKIVSQK